MHRTFFNTTLSRNILEGKLSSPKKVLIGNYTKHIGAQKILILDVSSRGIGQNLLQIQTEMVQVGAREEVGVLAISLLDVTTIDLGGYNLIYEVSEPQTASILLLDRNDQIFESGLLLECQNCPSLTILPSAFPCHLVAFGESFELPRCSPEFSREKYRIVPFS